METHNKQTEEQKDFTRGIVGFIVGWFFFFALIPGFHNLAVDFQNGTIFLLGYLVDLIATVIVALCVTYGGKKEHRSKWNKMPVAEKGWWFFILLLFYFLPSFMLGRFIFGLT